MPAFYPFRRTPKVRSGSAPAPEEKTIRVLIHQCNDSEGLHWHATSPDLSTFNLRGTDVLELRKLAHMAVRTEQEDKGIEVQRVSFLYGFDPAHLDMGVVQEIMRLEAEEE